MPREEKQSLHIQNEGERAPVEDRSKESRSFPFLDFLFSFKAINSFQAPFHAAETLLLLNYNEKTALLC